MANFSISIKSDFKELWRYNIIVMASIMRSGEQIELLKHCSEIAPVGSELSEQPKGYNSNRDIMLQSQDGDELTLYIYIIPHTLPKDNSVSNTLPFEMEVTVTHDANTAYKHRYMINQWSGENITATIIPAASAQE